MLWNVITVGQVAANIELIMDHETSQNLYEMKLNDLRAERD